MVKIASTFFASQRLNLLKTINSKQLVFSVCYFFVRFRHKKCRL